MSTSMPINEIVGYRCNSLNAFLGILRRTRITAVRHGLENRPESFRSASPRKLGKYSASEPKRVPTVGLPEGS